MSHLERADLARAVHRHQALQTIMDVALRHLDLERLLNDLLDPVCSTLVADTAAILLLSPQGTVLEARAAHGLEAGTSDVFIPVGRGVAGRIAADKRPLVINDLAQVDVYRPVLRAKGVRSLLGVPLRAGGRVIGVIHVGTLKPRTFTDDEAQLLQLMADRIGDAIEQARQYEAERQAHRATARAGERWRRLHAVTAALSQTLTRAQVAGAVIEQAIPALGAITGTAAVLTPDGLAFEVIAYAGLSEERVKPWLRFPADAPGPMADAVHLKELILLSTAETIQARYPALASFTSRHLAAAFVPLLVSERAVGALGLSFSEPREFNAEDREFMLAVGRQCALALERARLYDAEQAARAAAERTADRMSRLQAVTAQLSGALSPASVVEVILQQGLTASNAAAMAVNLVSDDGQWLENLDMVGFPAEVRAQYQRYPVSMAVPMAEAVRTGEPIWLTSQQAYIERYPHLAETIVALNIQAACALPLTVGNRTVGGLAISFSRGSDFDPNEREFLLTLAHQCVQALERARLYSAEQQSRIELEARVQERTTELHRSTEQLRQLSARLEAAREAERRRLSRELHDELGSALTGMKMEAAEMWRVSRDLHPDLAARLEAHQATLDQTLDSVRLLASELRPAILDKLGLLAAIEWQLVEFETRSGIECDLVMEAEDLPLEAESATAVFRVFQESLTNIARHAKATRVTVTVEVHASELELRVQDNGQGFNPADAAQAPSLGLAGMRERLYAVAGAFDVRSEPGHGTLVLVRVPLPRA